MRWRPKAGMETFNTTTQGIQLLSSEAQAAKDINLINHRLLATADYFGVLLNDDLNLLCNERVKPLKQLTQPSAKCDWRRIYWPLCYSWQTKTKETKDSPENKQMSDSECSLLRGHIS